MSSEKIIKEWLADYAALGKEEIHSFAASQIDNERLIDDIYYLIESHDLGPNNLIDDVCSTFFDFYRSEEPELQKFTIQFLPSLTYLYLNMIAHADKKSARSLEALIVMMYNYQVTDEGNNPKVISYRLPSLAQPSIYHEPMSLAPASLTESALRRLEECNTNLVRWGPLPHVERLIAQNRLQVMTALIFVYNRELSCLPKSTMLHLAFATSRLVTQGFSKQSSSQPSTASPNRIPLSPGLLSELVYALYYAKFNYINEYEIMKAVDDIHDRATYQLYSEILLLTNAFKNTSSSVSSSKSHLTGPISLLNSQNTNTANTTSVSKSMITNASFRTKKLPDDIPIQTPSFDETNVNNLSSISEETELPNHTTTPEIMPKRSLPKMAASLGKKTKEKLISVSTKVHKQHSLSKININGETLSETDEGVELGSDISSLNLNEAAG